MTYRRQNNADFYSRINDWYRLRANNSKPDEGGIIMQYNEVSAWKCIKCGLVLQTEKGKKRHIETCKYIPPVLDGQIELEYLKAGSNK